MSALYRLWGATRLRDIVEWQAHWIASVQRGFRPHNDADDVYWALRVEKALLSGEPLAGVMLDYS